VTSEENQKLETVQPSSLPVWEYTAGIHEGYSQGFHGFTAEQISEVQTESEDLEGVPTTELSRRG